MVVGGTQRHERLAASSPGISEAQIGLDAGLRNMPFRVTTYDNVDHLFSGKALGAASGAFTDVTKGPISATLLTKQLPFPCTPCFGLVHVANTGQVLRFRVTGFDQFGQPIQEITPRITLANAVYTATNALPTAYIWLSMVFSYIEKIEVEWSNCNAADLLYGGIMFPWDRCKGSAVIHHDHTAGQFKLTVNNPGVGDETTADIAYNASAAAVEAAIEALANVTDVSVTKSATSQTWLVTFQTPFRDYSDMTIINGTTPLSGGTLAIVTGDEFVGQDNIGVGLPIKVTPDGPPGIGQLKWPEVLGVMTRRNLTRLVPAAIALSANTAASPSRITLAAPHGLPTGHAFVGSIYGNSDTNLNGTWRCLVIDDVTIDVYVAAAVVGTTGDGSILISSAPAPEVCSLAEAAASAAWVTGNQVYTLTAAGYLVGLNASGGWKGSPHKLHIYLDSSGSTAVAARAIRPLNSGATAQARFNLGLGIDGPSPVDISCFLRTTIGTGRPVNRSQSYPRG